MKQVVNDAGNHRAHTLRSFYWTTFRIERRVSFFVLPSVSFPHGMCIQRNVGSIILKENKHKSEKHSRVERWCNNMSTGDWNFFFQTGHITCTYTVLSYYIIRRLQWFPPICALYLLLRSFFSIIFISFCFAVFISYILSCFIVLSFAAL